MSRLAFGQPLGGISQFAYVVEDIQRTMSDFTATFGIGPWFVRERFQPPDGRYRGAATDPVLSLARAFSGHAMIELIQQHDDQPSVFHEGPGPRRFGFHHWAVMTKTIDEDLARLFARGYEEAFSDRLPSGSRVVYVDTSPVLPGMVELIEHTPAQELMYTRIYEAAIEWDGRSLRSKPGTRL